MYPHLHLPDNLQPLSPAPAPSEALMKSNSPPPPGPPSSCSRASAAASRAVATARLRCSRAPARLRRLPSGPSSRPLLEPPTCELATEDTPFTTRERYGQSPCRCFMVYNITKYVVSKGQPPRRPPRPGTTWYYLVLLDITGYDLVRLGAIWYHFVLLCTTCCTSLQSVRYVRPPGNPHAPGTHLAHARGVHCTQALALRQQQHLRGLQRALACACGPVSVWAVG